LGFPKPPADTRVVVAMSGGVDSSVVAAELARRAMTWSESRCSFTTMARRWRRRARAAPGRDIHDARRVAEAMGFPHYVLDYESVFREAVMDEFADAYLGGATPVPCIRCNERVKFQDLLGTARDLDADCMATGHYIRRIVGPPGRNCIAPPMPDRDQSYFLFSTTPEQLAFLRFPLGAVPSKAETRALAARHGLSVADKPDSQDICFVPNGDYASVIEKLRPGAGEPGEIVDMAGRVLGRHPGVIHYTIGQRRGLGIGGLRRAALRRAARCRHAPRGGRSQRGAARGPCAGGRDQLAWRRGVRCRRGKAGAGAHPLDPAAAARDRPADRPHHGRGDPRRSRRGRLAGAGLRVLRNRGHKGAGRRVDCRRRVAAPITVRPLRGGNPMRARRSRGFQRRHGVLTRGAVQPGPTGTGPGMERALSNRMAPPDAPASGRRPPRGGRAPGRAPGSTRQQQAHWKGTSSHRVTGTRLLLVLS
jgi:tRNA (5-methylaminomethyl-2-thiouridylate)-methyltransferase